MDAVAREPVGAHAAAVNGATADAAPAPVDAAFAVALMQALIQRNGLVTSKKERLQEKVREWTQLVRPL